MLSDNYLSMFNFEVFCDHSAIAQILNGKKKLPTCRIQRLIEHLLPFNFTVQYLPGKKMHIADILSRLAGKDLEPSDQLIPISFNVLTRSKSKQTQPLKLYTADKHKQSQLPPSYIPPQNNLQKQHTKPHLTTSQVVETKTKTIHPQKKLIPPRIQAPLPKPTTISTLPPVPLGILRQSSPVTLPTPQKEVRKSLVNPHLKIPQTLPLLDLPPPDPKETLETYRPPDESLFRKPLPILKDAKELDVFTRHIPKQTDIDKFLKILKAKVTKSYDLSVSASELVKEYQHSPAFNSIYSYITLNVLPKEKRSQRMVIANAENYIVVNGVLFKLVKDKRTFDTPIKCLLVVPEKFENSVFHMFHDTLLGAHYGPVNTYYTIKDRYWMHNMFEKLQRYISSCDACQQQKQK